MPAEFQFLRPEWFFALPLILLIWPLARLAIQSATSWERAIDPRLLAHLLDRASARPSKAPLWLIPPAWLLALTALAVGSAAGAPAELAANLDKLANHVAAGGESGGGVSCGSLYDGFALSDYDASSGSLRASKPSSAAT